MASSRWRSAACASNPGPAPPASSVAPSSSAGPAAGLSEPAPGTRGKAVLPPDPAPGARGPKAGPRGRGSGKGGPMGAWAVYYVGVGCLGARRSHRGAEARSDFRNRSIAVATSGIDEAGLPNPGFAMRIAGCSSFRMGTNMSRNSERFDAERMGFLVDACPVLPVAIVPSHRPPSVTYSSLTSPPESTLCLTKKWLLSLASK